MTYDTFIFAHSMTFDREECVQMCLLLWIAQAHSLNASLYDQ